jgi:hypothetical protein
MHPIRERGWIDHTRQKRTATAVGGRALGKDRPMIRIKIDMKVDITSILLAAMLIAYA